MSEHGPNCKWPQGEPCREYSTDGTRLGAQIAHTMGTTDEEAITAQHRNDERNAARQALTGMPEEQAEWENLDD